MKNGDVQAAWSYHDGTKHSHWSVRNNPHFLDWANRPLPFKIYPTTEPIALPRDVPQTGVAAVAAISARVPLAAGDSVPDLPYLARILYFSADAIKQRNYPRRDDEVRDAACVNRRRGNVVDVA